MEALDQLEQRLTPESETVSRTAETRAAAKPTGSDSPQPQPSRSPQITPQDLEDAAADIEQFMNSRQVKE